MGIWQRIFGKGARESDVNAAVQKSSIEDWWREFGESSTAAGEHINQHTAMKVTTVLACVRLRSQDVAKLPPKIYRYDSSGFRREAVDHYLYQIFRKPNSWQTWFEFCETMQMAMLLRGNAYAVVVRDARGTPIELIPINPDRVSLWEAVGGGLFYQVSRGSPHQVAMLANFPVRIPDDDVIHLRFASSDSLIGLSPITLHAEGIGLTKGQERLAANLVGNGARPSGVLSTDKTLGDAAFKRVKASWAEHFGGTRGEKSGGTAILEEGLKWQQLTLSSVDMEFIASRKLQVEEICRIFGVSPVKVGVLESGIGKAFEQIQLAHYTDAVHPDLVRWELKLQVYFNLDPSLKVEFDETELLRADLTARANAARVLQVSGISTPNESRKGFGFNPYKARPDTAPDGDTLLVPANVVPIEKVGQAPGPGPGSDQTGAPAAGGDGDPTTLPATPTG